MGGEGEEAEINTVTDMDMNTEIGSKDFYDVYEVYDANDVNDVYDVYDFYDSSSVVHVHRISSFLMLYLLSKYSENVLVPVADTT